MELLDQRLQNIEKHEAVFKLEDIYQSLSSSSFSQEIFDIELSFIFALLKFELYDGIIDPIRHVLHYNQLMQTTVMPNSKKEVILCKVFALSLFDSVLVWFSRLPLHSVVSFLQLVKLFVNQFFDRTYLEIHWNHKVGLPQGISLPKFLTKI